MTKVHSSARGRRRKPQSAKPHPDYPLTAHPSGRWCKKIKGKLVYFGKIVANDGGASAQAALDKWLEEKDDLLAGRVPRKRPEGSIILNELVGRFLDTKKSIRDAGEMSPHTWDAYYNICHELVKAFGKGRAITDILPEDFESLRSRWAQRWGPQRLASEINRARVVFNYAYKNGLIPAPILYGEGFRRPSAKVLRLNRAAQGPKMFERGELRRMIDGATQPLKAMLLLGINCAFGNADVARLPLSVVSLTTGWLEYPRPKTGIMRRIPLWPETIEAITEWLTERPTPKDDAAAALVFLTVRGNAWDKGTGDRAITHETRKLLDRLKIGGKRNFYCVRHTFETIGGASKDQVAVDAIMGHSDDSMSAAYRERIDDDRLIAVSEYVRKWLNAGKAVDNV